MTNPFGNESVGFSSFQRMAVWNAYGRYVCGEPYWSTIECSCILAFSRILGAHFYVSPFPIIVSCLNISTADLHFSWIESRPPCNRPFLFVNKPAHHQKRERTARRMNEVWVHSQFTGAMQHTERGLSTYCTAGPTCTVITIFYAFRSKLGRTESFVHWLYPCTVVEDTTDLNIDPTNR